MKQAWCAFTSPDGSKCSFGAGHKIDYHYCDGWRYGRGGQLLSDAEYARITRGGTR